MVFLGACIIQGGKLEGEDIFLVRHFDGVLFGDRAVERNELIELLKRGNHNRRDVRIIPYTIRMEPDQAIAAAEEHLAFFVFVARRKLARPYRDAVAGVIVPEKAGLRSESRKSIEGAQPEAAISVLEDCADEIIRKILFCAHRNASVRVPVDSEKTHIRSDPDGSVPILA